MSSGRDIARGGRDVAFDLDGTAIAVRVADAATAADLLGLNEGCGEGVCGACTILVDGTPVRGCLMLAAQLDGAAVLTVSSLAAIEGAAADAAGLTPLQRALSARRAFQCGWCVPGLLVGTAAFLVGRSAVPRDEILAHLVGHLCRCTAGRGVVEAIEDVLAERREAAP